MDVEFLRYQFQDGFSGVITKNGFSIGVRHIQMAYMFVSAVVMGAIRGSIGVAVLAMTDENRRGDNYIQIHNWDRRIQGAILSSFLFGYALPMLPAELYLKKLGGKLVVTVMLLTNGALCVAMPTIANRVNHLDLSPHFGGVMLSITNFAASIGSILTPVTTSLILKDDPTDISRWRIVFFMAAGIAVAANIVYVIFGSADRQHWDSQEYCEKRRATLEELKPLNMRKIKEKKTKH